MFKLSKNNEINGNILKYDCIRFSLLEISTLNTSISQIYIDIPRKDSVISLLNSYLDLNFDAVNAESMTDKQIIMI